jgi:hypothetical protein
MGTRRDAWIAARSRESAARRLIAAYAGEFRALLIDERARRHGGVEMVSGGGADVA